jgi:hypothetical protein
MDWTMMCQELVIYARKQQIIMSIDELSLSSLIENKSFDTIISFIECQVLILTSYGNNLLSPNIIIKHLFRDFPELGTVNATKP